MVTLPIFKRGDTWSLTATLTKSGDPVSLDGVEIRSELRKTNAQRDLVESLVVTPAEQSVSPGVFILSPASGSTAGWPIGVLMCDMVFTKNGKVIRTDTFSIPVVEEVTQ